MARAQGLIDDLLGRELTEQFSHDITLAKSTLDAGQGKRFQGRDVILNEMSLRRSHDKEGANLVCETID